MPEESGRFTSGELALASWWVRNGLALRRAGYVVLSVISVVTWVYILWTLLDTYAISYPRESRLSADIARNQLQLAKLQQDTPENFRIGNVVVSNTTDKRVDMSVSVENTNALWWADVTYHFNLSGEDTPSRTGFVLPGRSMTMTELGYTPKSVGGRSADVIIDDVRWHHVDPAVTGSDVDAFMHDRVNFTNSKPTFNLVAIGKKSVGQTVFQLTNNSAYGYWSVDVIIRLFRGGSAVALTKLELPQFKPGETRPVNVTWTDALPGITKTDVEVVANPFDPASYLPTTRF